MNSLLYQSKGFVTRRHDFEHVAPRSKRLLVAERCPTVGVEFGRNVHNARCMQIPALALIRMVRQSAITFRNGQVTLNAFRFRICVDLGFLNSQSEFWSSKQHGLRECIQDDWRNHLHNHRNCINMYWEPTTGGTTSPNGSSLSESTNGTPSTLGSASRSTSTTDWLSVTLLDTSLPDSPSEDTSGNP